MPLHRLVSHLHPRRRPAGAVYALAILLGTVTPANAGERDPVTRIVELRHEDVATVERLLRNAGFLGSIATDRPGQRLILRGQPARLDAMTELVRRVDIRRPSWEAALVLVMDDGERIARRLVLEDGDVLVNHGNATPASPDRVHLQLQIDTLTRDSLALTHVTDARLSLRRPRPLRISEQGRRTLTPGEELTLVRVSDDGHRSDLARVFGFEGRVSEVLLRARPR